MRARLIALLAAGATIVAASPGMAQDRQALQSRQIAAAIAPPVAARGADTRRCGADRSLQGRANCRGCGGGKRQGESRGRESPVRRLRSRAVARRQDGGVRRRRAIIPRSDRRESAVAFRDACTHRRRAHEIALCNAPESSSRAVKLDQDEGRREPVHGRRTRIGQVQSADARACESDPGRRTE